MTRLEAGVADNVLPQRGRLVVNARLLPGDTAADAIAHVRAAVAPRDVARVSVAPLNGSASPPSQVTRADGAWFALLRRAVQEVWRVGDGDEPVPVLPFLLPGALCVCAGGGGKWGGG